MLKKTIPVAAVVATLSLSSGYAPAETDYTKMSADELAEYLIFECAFARGRRSRTLAALAVLAGVWCMSLSYVTTPTPYEYLQMGADAF